MRTQGSGGSRLREFSTSSQTHFCQVGSLNITCNEANNYPKAKIRNTSEAHMWANIREQGPNQWQGKLGANAMKRVAACACYRYKRRVLARERA